MAEKNPPFELKIQVDEKTTEGIYVNFLSFSTTRPNS